jgi:hypothetical protein
MHIVVTDSKKTVVPVGAGSKVITSSKQEVGCGECAVVNDGRGWHWHIFSVTGKFGWHVCNRQGIRAVPLPCSTVCSEGYGERQRSMQQWVAVSRTSH